MRTRLLLVVVLLLLGVGCGSTPKDIRYYQVVAPEKTAGQGDVVIGVEPFYADGPYADQRMVYRESEYRVDYYYYHRWSAPPALMVSEYLRTSLQSTGQFKTVLSGFTADAVAMVGGRIIAFEEVDASDEWRAHVILDLYLRDTQSGELVWSKKVKEEEVADEKSPEGIAKAMSLALGRLTEQVAPEISEAAEAVGRGRVDTSVAPATGADE